jgi:hypothetical protein
VYVIESELLTDERGFSPGHSAKRNFKNTDLKQILSSAIFPTSKKGNTPRDALPGSTV